MYVTLVVNELQILIIVPNEKPSSTNMNCPKVFASAALENTSIVHYHHDPPTTYRTGQSSMRDNLDQL